MTRRRIISITMECEAQLDSIRTCIEGVVPSGHRIVGCLPESEGRGLADHVYIYLSV